MEKEEEILNGYIKGTNSGEDNKLRASVGSLNSKRAKELTEALNSLKDKINISASNMITNNTWNTNALNGGMEHQVNNLKSGIREQVDKLISSNERLSKSNENYSKWMKWLTFVIAVTGTISLWNIYLTNDIKDESIKANQISQQPFLNVIGDRGTPIRFLNSGKGVAVNIMLVRWDNRNKLLYITPEGQVGMALGVNNEGYLNNFNMATTTFSHLQEKIPSITKLITKATSQNTNWLALVYEDISGKHFSTLMRGAGGNYEKAIEFLTLDN